MHIVSGYKCHRCSQLDHMIIIIGPIAEKYKKAGVAISFPRMVCYKMVGLDTALVWTYLDLAHRR